MKILKAWDQQRGDSLRAGFTLIELLVVIFVIALLVALLVPAVQMAREAARRTSCRSNLKQLALALHTYQERHQVLPPGTQIDDVRPPRDIPGRGALRFTKHFPWIVMILPDIDQGVMYAQFNFDLDCQHDHRPLTSQQLKILQCASDPAAGQPVYWDRPYYEGPWGSNNYLGVSGTNMATSKNYAWQCAEYDREAGKAPIQSGLLYENSNCRLRDVTDGTSQTLLLGERGIVQQWGKWGGAGVEQRCPFGLGDTVLPGTIDDQLYPGGLRERQETISDRLFWWSWHGGVVHMAFADGSVRGVSVSTDRGVLTAWSTRAGGEVGIE